MGSKIPLSVFKPRHTIRTANEYNLNIFEALICTRLLIRSYYSKYGVPLTVDDKEKFTNFEEI